jgi:ribosomal protein L11 methyltransferase
MSARTTTEPVYIATIEAPASDAGEIAACFEAADGLATVAVMLFECGEHRVEVSAYYTEEPDREGLIELIEGAVSKEDLAGLRIEPLPDKNWVAEAERFRCPVRAGRFLVHGAHDRGKVPAGRFTLEIDAGLAFGTAHHATTRGCLIALDRLLKRRRPHCVLDVGTGTGILAIAAARALTRIVVASDMDQVAVAVTAENARKNGVRSRIRLVQAEGLAHPVLRRALSPIFFSSICCSCPCSTLLPLLPASFGRADSAFSPAFSRHKRVGSKRGFAPSASRSIHESFSMNGRRCCFDVAARTGRLPIDRDGARPCKAGPCFKTSTRSARPT